MAAKYDTNSIDDFILSLKHQTTCARNDKSFILQRVISSTMVPDVEMM